MDDGTVPKRPASPGGVRALVSNRQRLPVDEGALAALAERTLAAEGYSEGELSISFVSPEEMEDLHVRYMDEKGTTDVLSFPLDEDGLLGDVVVCPAEAARNNPELESELRLLVVHGVLHLLGYDHQDQDERARMWAKQDTYARNQRSRP
jgi:probable rRNA maturation factor